jgi:hypothetical protein
VELPGGGAVEGAVRDGKTELTVHRDGKKSVLADLERDQASFQANKAHEVADHTLQILAATAAEGPALIQEAAPKVFGLRTDQQYGVYPQLPWVLFVVCANPPFQLVEPPESSRPSAQGADVPIEVDPGDGGTGKEEKPAPPPPDDKGKIKLEYKSAYVPESHPSAPVSPPQQPAQRPSPRPTLSPDRIKLTYGGALTTLAIVVPSLDSFTGPDAYAARGRANLPSFDLVGQKDQFAQYVAGHSWKAQIHVVQPFPYMAVQDELRKLGVAIAGTYNMGELSPPGPKLIVLLARA